MQKECKACYTEKELIEFHRKKDGDYYPYCKECHADYRQIRKRREKERKKDFEIKRGNFDVSFD